MSFCDSKVIDYGSIKFEIVGDEGVWHKTVFLQKLAHEFQRRPFVPIALDQNIKHFALGVDAIMVLRVPRAFSVLKQNYWDRALSV